MADAVKIQPSLDDLYEALEDAMYHVRECKAALEGIEQYESWRVIMDEVLGEMKAELVPIEGELSREEAAELAAMNRDYWASVL